jgi:hypothetical protein
VLTELSPLIAATAQWLTRAFPASGGALAAALCEVQARQAVTVAACLRYPTRTDAALVAMAGPGGSARLDWVTGADAAGGEATEDSAWRTWVDEVVASWAASLLTDPELARQAVAELTRGPQHLGTPTEFRRLIEPGVRDRDAAALLRHPDLVAPVAELHLDHLLDRLGPDQALIA